MKKRTAWLALAWTLASRLAWAATGQSPPLEVKVYAGPAAPYGQGKAIAVTTLIRNGGPAKEAALEANWTSPGMTPPFKSMALSIPARSRRLVRFHVSAKPRYIRGSVIRIVIRAGDDAASAEADLAWAETGVVIGKVGVSIALPGGRARPPARPPLWALPDSHMAYYGVPAILVGDAQLSALSPAQVEAIKGYVFHGGTLAVSAGVRGPALLQSFVGDLLPGARCDIVPLDKLDGLARRYRAPIDLKGAVPCAALSGPGIVGVVLEGDVPVISRRAVGRGVVVWLGVDVLGPAFQGWRGLPALWRSVAASDPSGAPTALNLVQQLEAIPPEPTPFVWILVYCVFYILCVGPGVYWLLNRLKKPMAIWVCFPAVVAVFMALFPLLRVMLAGASSNLFVASLVERFPGEAQARVRAVGVVFSRGREEHTLAFPGVKGSALVGLRAGAPRLVHAKSEDAGVVVEPLPVDMWGRETFELEGVTTRAPQVSGRCVDLGSGRMKVEITNAGDEALPVSVLVGNVRGNAWAKCPIPPIAPGGAYEGEVSMKQSTGLNSFPWPALFQESLQREPRLGGAVAALVVSDRYSQSGNVAQRTLDLFDQPSLLSGLAWPAAQGDRYLETKVDCRTLVVWLPLETATPRIRRIQFGEVQPKSYRTQESQGSFKEGTVREFRLFSGLGSKLLGLTVRVRYYELKGSYRLQIYNYADQRWDSVALPRSNTVHVAKRNRWGRNMYRREAIIPNPDRYVSRPPGVVTLRENMPLPQAALGPYGNYGRRSRWVDVQATVKRPATR